MFSLKNSSHRWLFWKYTEIHLIWEIRICYSLLPEPNKQLVLFYWRSLTQMKPRHPRDHCLLMLRNILELWGHHVYGYMLVWDYQKEHSRKLNITVLWKKTPKTQVKCDPFVKENLEMKSSYFLNSVMGGDIREKRCAFIILWLCTVVQINFSM